MQFFSLYEAFTFCHAILLSSLQIIKPVQPDKLRVVTVMFLKRILPTWPVSYSTTKSNYLTIITSDFLQLFNPYFNSFLLIDSFSIINHSPLVQETIFKTYFYHHQHHPFMLCSYITWVTFSRLRVSLQIYLLIGFNEQVDQMKTFRDSDFSTEILQYHQPFSFMCYVLSQLSRLRLSTKSLLTQSNIDLNSLFLFLLRHLFRHIHQVNCSLFL